jgi:RHS repeat-associated protein
MRDGAGAALVYLHGDQLGSASLATSMTGAVMSQQRYKPYGEVRWSSGSMPTDFTFTSQRAGPANYVGSLTDYVARFYSPALGRFISADTIVPGAGRPQAFNRYAYALGNPIGLVDPSGHASIPPWWSWQLGGDEGAFTELEHLEMALLVSIRGTLLSDRQNPKDPDCRTCVLAGGNLLHAIVQLDALGRLGARTLEAPVVGAGPSGVECGCADIVLPDGSFYEVKARASYFRDADATRAQVSLMTDRPYDGMILGPGAKPDAKSWDIDLTGFGAEGRQLHVEWMAPGVLVYDLRGARRDIPDLTPIGIFEAFRKWLVERQKRPDRLPPIVPQPGPVPAPSWSPQQLQMP